MLRLLYAKWAHLKNEPRHAEPMSRTTVLLFTLVATGFAFLIASALFGPLPGLAGTVFLLLALSVLVSGCLDIISRGSGVEREPERNSNHNNHH